jgi:hypothetical protein
LASTRTPTDKELSTCRHIVLSSDHAWDPQNVRFPEASRTVEEELSRPVGAFTSQNYRDDNYSEESSGSMLFDIGDMSRRIIASVKTSNVPRHVSQAEKEDVPQAYIFQSTGRHSSVLPEDLSERW